MHTLFRTTFSLIGIFVLASRAWAAVDGDEPATDPPSASFTPGEISIGEPIQLPPRRPAEPPPAGRSSSANGRATPAAAGNGWIGLTVDEKLVTGRLVVVDVAPAGPAERAGVRLQDQLLAIDGMPLRTADQLSAALAAIAPGSTVKVAIGRGERIEELSLQAISRSAVRPPVRDWQAAEPAAPPAAGPFAGAAVTPAPDAAALRGEGESEKGRTALGVRTMPVDPSVQARFNLPEPAGALVIGVVHDLPASKAGVPPGSVIVALDNQPVRSPSELTRIVTSGPVGRPVTLQFILPGGEKRRAEVSLQSLEVPLERVLVGPQK